MNRRVIRYRYTCVLCRHRHILRRCQYAITRDGEVVFADEKLRAVVKVLTSPYMPQRDAARESGEWPSAEAYSAAYIRGYDQARKNALRALEGTLQ